MFDYDKTLMDSYISYLNTNNLYGYAMCEYLPQSNFKRNFEEWANNKILAFDDRGNKGYFFYVYLHYLKKFLDLHNGYALAPDNQAIMKDTLNSMRVYS